MAAFHEVPLAASYYVLFSNLENDRKSSTQKGAEQQSAGVFWEEDVWTAEEELEAEQTLKESRERCHIRNNCVVSTGKKEDEQAWNKFYSQHQTNFFKDRHYLHKAFPKEFNLDESSTERQQRTLVEIGCGVGNALLPLLEDEEEESQNSIQWTVHGLDLSKVAIDWLKQDERYIRATEQNRAHAYVCDISEPGFPEQCQTVSDVTTLLFCLSAIAPGEPMVQAVKNVASTLKPHGVLVFRDYGRFDEAQMKLGTSRNKQLDDNNFYRKHDGTKCYYFDLDDVRDLFEREAGLQVLELDYIRRIYRNRGTNEVRRRVWVQGRFQKE